MRSMCRSGEHSRAACVDIRPLGQRPDAPRSACIVCLSLGIIGIARIKRLSYLHDGANGECDHPHSAVHCFTVPSYYSYSSGRTAWRAIYPACGICLFCSLCLANSKETLQDIPPRYFARSATARSWAIVLGAAPIQAPGLKASVPDASPFLVSFPTNTYPLPSLRSP